MLDLFIIAGLLAATGYMFTRWMTNLGELKQWKALVANRQDIIEAMQAEDLEDVLVDVMEEELVAARLTVENLTGALAAHKLAGEIAQRRAEEAERLLGLVNDRLIVLQLELRNG